MPNGVNKALYNNKKIMKKLGLLLLSVFVFTAVTMAQRPGMGDFDPKEMAKRQTDELTEVLDLNKEQQKKVLLINTESGEKMAKMREKMSDGGDRTAMREEMTKIRDIQNKALKDVLTEEQYKKYEKYLEERRGNRGRAGGGGQ